MNTSSQAVTPGGKLVAGSDYQIVYQGSAGCISFRVVKFSGPDERIYDWGAHGYRSFTHSKILISRKVLRAQVPKAVAKFYNGNKVKYYRYSPSI